MQSRRFVEDRLAIFLLHELTYTKFVDQSLEAIVNGRRKPQ